MVLSGIISSIAMENGPVEIVFFPINRIMDLSSSLCEGLPECKPPFSHGFSYGFTIFIHFPMDFQMVIPPHFLSCPVTQLETLEPPRPGHCDHPVPPSCGHQQPGSVPGAMGDVDFTGPTWFGEITEIRVVNDIQPIYIYTWLVVWNIFYFPIYWL